MLRPDHPAMTPFPNIAGSIASLMSFTQFVVAAGFAFVVGITYDGSPRPMTTAIGIAALLALVTYRTLIATRGR